MTIAEYQYKLQEFNKVLKDHKEFKGKSEFYDSFDELLGLAYNAITEWDHDIFYMQTDVDDAHAQIMILESNVKFYQDILKKTNDALCDMINIVKERQDDSRNMATQRPEKC